MKKAIRKAVFPAAGLGTRFLPATKAQPKEMLPLVDKPIIQYGVEEALASGVSNIILVTGRGKNAIEDHFDVSVELETFLEARGKKEQLEEVRKISNLINFAYVRQGEPLGLGHAVLVTQELVGDEPFAVILGDDVIDAEPPALQQMIDVFNEVGGPVLAVERVPRDEISSYGVIAIDETASLPRGVYKVSDLVEKPPKEEAPSDLAIIGRYILTPDIFAVARETAKDRTGEIQLTNGLRHLLKSRPIYACEVDGVRHDTGNKLGFLKAVVYFALRRPDLSGPFAEYLRSVSVQEVVNDQVTRAGPSGSAEMPSCLVLLLTSAGGLALGLALGLAVALALRAACSGLAEGFAPPIRPRCRSRSCRSSCCRRSCRSARLPLPRVVGDVPPRALELDGGRRRQLLDRALSAGRGRPRLARPKTSE